uniref:DNA-directed RNA polymerase V subunit 1 n=1 Tax=Noccaea caerulescens TaxID=107243 RepID=A0A1J3I6X2_NOCCA
MMEILGLHWHAPEAEMKMKRKEASGEIRTRDIHLKAHRVTGNQRETLWGHLELEIKTCLQQQDNGWTCLPPRSMRFSQILSQSLKTVRNIMHHSGYKDGDPISSDDQMFVQEKILKFHPEKEAKLGAGVDFITVDKHTLFQDSRCFFVVSTDGSRQDFSYLKCIKNFLAEKYTSMAEEFNGKYFKKKSLPSGGNQDKNKDATTGETFDRSQETTTEIPGSPSGIGAEETQDQTET